MQVEKEVEYVSFSPSFSLSSLTAWFLGTLKCLWDTTLCGTSDKSLLSDEPVGEEVANRL